MTAEETGKIAMPNHDGTTSGRRVVKTVTTIVEEYYDVDRTSAPIAPVVDPAVAAPDEIADTTPERRGCPPCSNRSE